MELKSLVCGIAICAFRRIIRIVSDETLKPGELVWAWDEETGDVALKPVKQLFINESDELIHLTVNGEEITTTPTHPFYVAHKGWYAAVDLRAGDILVLVNGEYVTLEKTQHEILEAPITVYNFEVEDYHTYYVGTDGVLVHNACSQRAAMRKAKRSENIPMSQKPTSVKHIKMTGANGRRYYARVEVYGNKYIRNDWGGHLFKDGATIGRHYNAGTIANGKYLSNGKHFWY